MFGIIGFALCAALVLMFFGVDVPGFFGINLLEWAVNTQQSGKGSNYWLVKGSMGIEDRVSLVFGYMDDRAACQDIADALNEKFPAGRYYCKAAN